MRKYLSLGLMLVMVFAAAIVSAATTADGGKKLNLHGEITSIDATAQTFTISHDKETSTFKIDSATKFRGLLAKDIAFGDLKVGDNVHVSYVEVGTDKTATRVDVAHGKKKM
jgi:hypothetical protein